MLFTQLPLLLTSYLNQVPRIGEQDSLWDSTLPWCPGHLSLLQRVMVAQPVSFVTLARIQTSYFINSLPLWVALMPSCG